jgi:hypothetical protein
MQAKQAEESPFFIGQRNSGTHEEISKHAGPTDKPGKNQFGPEEHWFPPDRLSGIKYWVCCIKEPCLISNLSKFKLK